MAFVVEEIGGIDTKRNISYANKQTGRPPYIEMDPFPLGCTTTKPSKSIEKIEVCML